MLRTIDQELTDAAAYAPASDASFSLTRW